jgi:hypothetical protein
VPGLFARPEPFDSMKLADIHSLVGILRTAAWQIAAAYATVPSLWLLVHPFTDFWHRNRAPIKSMALVWIGMWATARWITWPFRTLLLYSTPLTLVPGLVLIGLGFSIYRHIGDVWICQTRGPIRNENRQSTAASHSWDAWKSEAPDLPSTLMLPARIGHIKRLGCRLCVGGFCAGHRHLPNSI